MESGPTTVAGLHVCTLVWQYNYGALGGQGASVWVYFGDGRQDLESDAELASLPGWVRLIGPVDTELATSVHGALKLFLLRAGVVVHDEGVAD